VPGELNEKLDGIIELDTIYVPMEATSASFWKNNTGYVFTMRQI
jgi:hypothetical protein